MITHSRRFKSRGNDVRPTGKERWVFPAPFFAEPQFFLLTLDGRSGDRSQMIEEPPPSETTLSGPLSGAVVASVGIVAAVAVLRQPGGLQVPLWVAMVACLSFVLSGVVLALKTSRFEALYRWSVVLLLLCMGAVPAWLTFGSVTGVCTASLPFIGGPLGCRLAFGASTCLVLLMLWLAIKEALRRPVV